MRQPSQARELPIACSLGAGDLKTRQAELSALGRRSLISIERRGGKPVLKFSANPATKVELERIVAAERECCAFLTLSISDRDPLELLIDGPADASLVIDELLESFAAEAVA